MPAIQFGEVEALACAAGSITEYEVTFSSTFSSTPRIFLTLYTASTSANMGYVTAMYADSSTSGFTIRIANADTSNRTPSVQWLAVGRK